MVQASQGKHLSNHRQKPRKIQRTRSCPDLQEHEYKMPRDPRTAKDLPREVHDSPRASRVSQNPRSSSSRAASTSPRAVNDSPKTLQNSHRSSPRPTVTPQNSHSSSSRAIVGSPRQTVASPRPTVALPRPSLTMESPRKLVTHLVIISEPESPISCPTYHCKCQSSTMSTPYTSSSPRWKISASPTPKTVQPPLESRHQWRF